MMHKLSVSEALRKIQAGESLNGCSIDFDRIKIEALDVMKLAKAGILVPEEAIYYDDADIVPDEDFEGDWVRIEKATSPKTEVQITLPEDIRQWVEKNQVPLDKLIEKLLDGFYQAQKTTSYKA